MLEGTGGLSHPDRRSCVVFAQRPDRFSCCVTYVNVGESGMVFEHEAESTTDVYDPFQGRVRWRAGAVSGFVAAAVMGVAITLTELETLRVAIAGLYGFEGSLLVGWTVHLLHGTLFGLGFAAVLSDPGLYRLTDWWWKTLATALVYALILAVVGAGFVMPLWLEFVGVATVEAVPHLTVPLIAWHLVYGLVLGAVYPLAERTMGRADAA